MKDLHWVQVLQLGLSFLKIFSKVRCACMITVVNDMKSVSVVKQLFIPPYHLPLHVSHNERLLLRVLAQLLRLFQRRLLGWYLSLPCTTSSQCALEVAPKQHAIFELTGFCA